MNNKIKIPSNFNAVIVFDDGSYVFLNTFERSEKKVFPLELCFTTAITGYQETMTDPSYAGQALVFSNPHIGNTGINFDDLESSEIYTKAIILSEKPSLPSNFRSKKTFEDWVIDSGSFCFFGIDTRELIQRVRSGEIKNACFGVFNSGDEVNIEEMKNLAKNYNYNFESLIRPILSNQKRSEEIEKICKNSEKNKKRALVFDFGIKLNILRCLSEAGFYIKDVFPFDFNSEKINFSDYDCIVFSNGPGDPSEAFELNKDLVFRSFESGLPILGICLGHQIIGFSHTKLKMEVFKMKQGHRGSNHPVQNLKPDGSFSVEITSQNHGFALSAQNEESKKFINRYSLFDGSIAGFFLPEEKIITTQYHPESSAGTHDSRFIFKEFFEMVNN